MFSEGTIDRILGINILAYAEKRGGSFKKTGTDDYTSLCLLPGHAEKTPSFHVHPNRGFFKCFGCGEGGNVIHLVAKLDGVRLGDAIRTLAAHAGIHLSCDMQPQRRRSAPSAKAVREALERGAARLREREAIDGELLTSELNAVRYHVATVYDVKLKPLKVPLSEGSYGGRERDPLWGVVLERAWGVIWLRRVGSMPLSLGRHAELGLKASPHLFVLAEDLAAAVMRRVERRARLSLSAAGSAA